ncbi:MAG TPA: bifunctional precorrin-2 dehydrogenase/sirohydrochlorin ferrochelatase [Chitinophagales bacterium]|jgi:precorrin-2 dehydrogenase/sirohydrochlorin ferrochelatase|nr:bifunctional precorrin-2 dehydrogenase/sirohydrochlorin ferrochelatase [Chitinophagales bacterium]
MNTLYPIFLKTENFNILIVGGGFVGTEKLSFILKNSPNANITVVAKEISDEIKSMVNGQLSIVLTEKPFEKSDLENKQLAIAATADKELNEAIYRAAKEKNILINVADTPELCDFYLGSIVTKGDLKIAISTNGKSPTLSKRIREFFEDILPENINDLILNLNDYRKTLKGNFEEKVDALNEITKSFKNKKK